MVSPNRRTWTLTGLPRDRDYRLWFCERERRWEVEVLGAWVPPSSAPWPDEVQGLDETELDPPTEWPRPRPDGPQRSEDRPAGITARDRWTRPAWLRPL